MQQIMSRAKAGQTYIKAAEDSQLSSDPAMFNMIQSVGDVENGFEPADRPCNDNDYMESCLVLLC